MRASYMSINRVDVQQAVKQVISEQMCFTAPRADTDSDCAGCVLTRKSMTFAHLFHGVNLIKAGSWTQGMRSLSVAESEFYAGVKGGSTLLIAKSMMMDFGENVAQCVLGADSSSTKSIMERHGAGRIRHLHCLMSWLEGRVDSGEMRTERRKGEHNTSDIDTKVVTSPVLRKRLKTFQMD